MTKPNALLQKLKRAIEECEQVFDVKSLATTQKTGTERHSRHELLTRAYLVLVHAALEEFFELLAEHVADQSAKAWAGTKKNIPATALMLFHGKPDGDFEDMEARFTDRGRKSLEVSIDRHKEQIIENNHGISNRHLRSLFFPLGVDLPEETKLTSAIEELKKIRGDAAHRMRSGLSDLKSMKEWLEVVHDCVLYCERLVQIVNAIQW